MQSLLEKKANLFFIIGNRVGVMWLSRVGNRVAILNTYLVISVANGYELDN